MTQNNLFTEAVNQNLYNKFFIHNFNKLKNHINLDLTVLLCMSKSLSVCSLYCQDNYSIIFFHSCLKKQFIVENIFFVFWVTTFLYVDLIIKSAFRIQMAATATGADRASVEVPWNRYSLTRDGKHHVKSRPRSAKIGYWSEGCL